MTAFRPGQAVVCIRDNWLDRSIPVPVKGRVYTIEALVSHPEARDICLTFAAFPGCCMEARAFRPVATPRTSIAIFKALLVPTKQRQCAPC